MTITKRRADRCTTHHHACDCREYRYQEMEKALKVISFLAEGEMRYSNISQHNFEIIEATAIYALNCLEESK